MVEDPDEPLPVAAERGPEREDAERVAAMIRDKDGAWSDGQASDYGGLRWRPDLSRSGPASILHVHLVDRLRPYLLERLAASYAAGHEVHLATPLATLYNEEFLLEIHTLDPQIHLVDAGLDEVRTPVGLLRLLGDEGTKVGPEVRTALAVHAVKLSQEEGLTPIVKGRRYENAIAFLLDQVSDFKVIERNLRADTEELDIVVQQRATQGRAWSIGAPFILVEAKNWKKRVDQPVVSVFRVKIEGKRGTVRLGLIFGASGFTSDAMHQEMKFASGQVTIACVNDTELDDWINTPDGDDYIEKLVRTAMLR